MSIYFPFAGIKLCHDLGIKEYCQFQQVQKHHVVASIQHNSKVLLEERTKDVVAVTAKGLWCCKNARIYTRNSI